MKPTVVVGFLLFTYLIQHFNTAVYLYTTAILTLKLPGPYVGMGGSLTVTVA